MNKIIYEVIDFGAQKQLNNSARRMTELLNEGWKITKQYDVRCGSIIILYKEIEGVE